MSYHFIHGGCGIKPFIDLYLLQQKIQYNNETVREYCKKCKIEQFFDNLLNLTDVWFNGKSHTPLSLKCEEYIFTGGVYGTLENRVQLAQSKQGGKIKYIFSRIFVPYSTLRNYYPILNKHKWLLPIMQVGRWMKLIFKGKLDKGVREFKASQNISKSQQAGLSDFLDEIGL